MLNTVFLQDYSCLMEARTLEALNNALNALQRDHESEKCRSEGIGERGKEGDERKMERSGIPRRLVSVGSRAG